MYAILLKITKKKKIYRITQPYSSKANRFEKHYDSIFDGIGLHLMIKVDLKQLF
jgi:hypothetical protein